MNLVLAVTGASGAYAAELLLEKSPWPVTLLASKLGQGVYAHECGPFRKLIKMAHEYCEDDDLWAPIASGSVPTAGMVILPCSGNTLGRIAAGLADNLITRAAHCHLKERRKLILCLRETPVTTIDLENGAKVAAAGGMIMPLTPPFYMFAERDPRQVTMRELLSAYVDRVLAALGHPAAENWESARELP